MRRMNTKIIALIFVVVTMLILVTGCVQETVEPTVENEQISDEQDEPTIVKESLIVEETDTTLTFKDVGGELITVKKNPSRVISLYNSYLDLWYMTGAEAVGRVNGTTGVPEEAMDIETVGKWSQPNIEAVLALNPDMVIMRATISKQRAIEDQLKANNIDTCYVDYTTFDEFLQVVEVFAHITGDTSVFEETIEPMISNMDKLKEKVGNIEGPEAMVLFSTSKSLSIENEEGTTGAIVKELGGKNIVKENIAEGKTRIDFSLETIVERNPKIILIKTMGNIDDCKNTLEVNAMSNEAWNEIDAVKDGNIHFLDKNLFMYKPNKRYFEAYLTMAKLLYPNENFSEFDSEMIN
ncbi:MAG: ABC transporter substrate-binding protein [Bacillota bacterium]|nr:ABC transporter substrate-binding protein [Bacillota bacterium]